MVRQVLRTGSCALAAALTALAFTASPFASAATTPLVPGAVKTIPGKVDPTAVACPPGAAVAATTCDVLGSTSTSNQVNQVTDSNPKPGVVVAGGGDVACMTATTCLVVGESSQQKGTLIWLKNGHVSKSVALKNSSYLLGATCTTTTCIVTGEVYGKPTKTGTPTFGVIAVVAESQSSPTAVRVAGVGVVNAVACASPTSCYAVGSTTGTTTGVAVLVPVTHGRIGARRLVSGSDALDRISCGTALSCWATGTAYSAHAGVTTVIFPVTNGKAGTKVAGPPIGGAISCISATTCFFASGTSQYGKGKVDELSNGRVVRSVVIPKFAYGSLSSIVCPTATACLATGATGFHNPGPSYYYTGAVVTLHV
jgi:hypothetical protein